MSEVYINGHQSSVLRSHSWRTAENSAAYLLSSLEPHMHILDVGCGPGTITVDLATRVPKGQAIGLEDAPEVLEQARATAAEHKVENVRFVVGDVTSLPYPDHTFDVVHAHQVLQHVPNPVKALSEMRRVTKRDGIVAVRECDFSAMAWYPEMDSLSDWQQLHLRVARSKGGEPDAGRRLVAWARQAGFDRSAIKATAGTWCYSTPDERAWWSDMWADRMVSSTFAHIAVKEGFATDDGLSRLAQGWREWGTSEDAWIALLHGEILCRV
jgi:ubiquinone/menaquinone biosynthesis C-methylase UbiE